MLKSFHRTFLKPLKEDWFREGLVIECASAATADRAFAKLWAVLPGITFDLLSRRERASLPFRNRYRVQRPFGGIRLLLHGRKRYDLVVLFAAGERELWLCRALALVVMRPRRFIVFNEFGEAFWLSRENWPAVRKHLEMRWDWANKRKRWRKRRQILYQAVLGLPSLPMRMVRIVYAGLLFFAALFLLACLRTIYDSTRHRFRFFAKPLGAPSRDPGAQSARLTSTEPTPERPARFDS